MEQDSKKQRNRIIVLVVGVLVAAISIGIGAWYDRFERQRVLDRYAEFVDSQPPPPTATAPAPAQPTAAAPAKSKIGFYLIRTFDATRDGFNIMEAKRADNLSACVVLVRPEHARDGMRMTLEVEALGNQPMAVVNTQGGASWTSTTYLPTYQER